MDFKKFLELSKEEQLLEISSSKVILISLTKRNVSFSKDNNLIAKPTKHNFFREFKSSFLSTEEVLQFLEKYVLKDTFPNIEDKLLQYNPFNQNGFINHFFYPSFFIYKHERGFLICDGTLFSYPMEVIDEKLMVLEDLELVIELSKLIKEKYYSINKNIYNLDYESIINNRKILLFKIDKSLLNNLNSLKDSDAFNELAHKAIGVVEFASGKSDKHVNITIWDEDNYDFINNNEITAIFKTNPIENGILDVSKIISFAVIF
jgi:hypothetical protein